MTMAPSRLRRQWSQFFGAKDDSAITREARRQVLRQPLVRDSMKRVRQSERLLASLEALEGEKADE